MPTQLQVVRQTVAYFQPIRPSGLGYFPVWACLGSGEDITHYGLPEFAYGRAGVKVARHVVVGDDDPDEVPTSTSVAEIASLRSFVDAQFTNPPEHVLSSEHCLYTCTPTEDFIVDIVRDEPRIVVAAGLSGHGFKFGPLLGRMLADLAIDGETSLPRFRATPSDH